MIGVCFGGGFALLLAPPSDGFSASSVNYGNVPKDADSFLARACRIVGSYGARDSANRRAAEKLEQALERNAVPHEYHDPSALDARRRIAAFLSRHLSGAAEHERARIAGEG